ncbi:MAG: TlpA disulfide reductase family protein [Pseudomonadota bacterium]
MKRILLNGLVACLTLVSLSACTPDRQIRFADGSTTQMSHWDGRKLVINYWADWCAPCREEIPELNELHHARVEHGLVVLGVNYDQLQGQDLLDDIAALQIEFPNLVVDPQVEYGYERAQILPMTVVIDEARQVKSILVGPQTAASVLAAAAD